MKTIQNVNPAHAYMEGMLWAAFGVKVVSGNAVEWQIDAMKVPGGQVSGIRNQ